LETFAKLDSKLYLNPKWIMFSSTHPLAAVVWVGSITYCVDNLTDGFIPDMIASRVLGADSSIAQDLEEADMWERVSDGWQVHDFLTAQQSRAQVEASKKAKAAAGRLGGKKSGESRRSATEAGASHPIEAPASRLVEANLNQNEPDTDTDLDLDTTTTPTPPKTAAADDSRFQEFLEAYPKKGNSEASRREWDRITSEDLAQPGIIVDAAREAARQVRSKQIERRHLPQPANFLRDRQWENFTPLAASAPVSDGWIQDHVTLKLPPGADWSAATRRFRSLVKTGMTKGDAAQLTIKEQSK
jgi:hypothetical protein